MVFSDWLTAIDNAWFDIIRRFIEFIPNLIGAIIILVLGWVIGALVALVLDRGFRIIGLQTLFEKARIEDTLKKANIEQDTTALLSSVAKWIIYLVSFVAAANILKLTEVASFLDRILLYIPSVIAATAILLIGIVFASFLSRVIKASVKASGLHSAELLATIVRYAIVIFTFMAALVQLGIAEALIQTLVVGIVAFLAIAGGLSFGLGGKDAAQEWIEKLKKEIKS